MLCDMSLLLHLSKPLKALYCFSCVLSHVVLLALLLLKLQVPQFCNCELLISIPVIGFAWHDIMSLILPISLLRHTCEFDPR